MVPCTGPARCLPLRCVQHPCMTCGVSWTVWFCLQGGPCCLAERPAGGVVRRTCLLHVLHVVCETIRAGCGRAARASCGKGHGWLHGGVVLGFHAVVALLLLAGCCWAACLCALALPVWGGGHVAERVAFYLTVCVVHVMPYRATLGAVLSNCTGGWTIAADKQFNSACEAKALTAIACTWPPKRHLLDWAWPVCGT